MLPQRSRRPEWPAGADWARGLAETTAAAVLVFRDRFLYVNPAAARLAGVRRDRLVGAELEALLHPDELEAARLAVQRAAAGEILPQHDELRVVDADGEERILDATFARVDWQGGAAILVSAIDRTERRRAERELAAKEESLRLVQRAARSVYWEWEPDTDRLSVAVYGDELAGFSLHHTVRTGTEFVDLVHPDDRDLLRKALVATLRDGDDLAVELRFVDPSGEVRWLAERAVAVRSEKGWTARVIGVAHDVTERKVAEEALFQEKERADVTLASIADGVLRTDERGVIDYMNPVAQRLTGWSLAEAYGRPVDEIYKVVDAESGTPLTRPLGGCLEDGRESIFAGDRLLVDRDGTRRPVHDSAAPILSRLGRVAGAVLVFRDLSRLREIESEVDRLANHDALTGLVNRRAFAALLEEAVRDASPEDRRHALCHLDLDNFRLVNDTSGQAAGDRLIQQTAAVLRSRLREGDALAHFGGDIFAVLLRDCTTAEAHNLAEDLRQAVRGARFVWQRRSFNTPMSAGLIGFGSDADPAELLRDADAACSVAKERGGDRIHSYQPGDSAIAERYGQMQWISRITEAFDEDRFLLYRQSIVPLQSGAAEPPFYEILIRLRDQSGRLITPGSFIPAAERFGMISQIDRWVLRTTLERMAQNGASIPPDTRFTINVSGCSLGVNGFLELVVEQFERTGVDPSRVLFEITETAAITDLPHAERFLSVLKRMGCRFILDDFGKGLSSLGYLRNLPLDFLKIDGGFVRNVTADPVQTALVASIHEIGDVLGLATIAESVEDEETLETVRQLGIDYAQGFLLARPEPIDG